MSLDIVDNNGNPATIGIEAVFAGITRADTRTFQVYYHGIFFDAEFYMDVTNNQVTDVRDYAITTIGATYDNVVLSKTSTYGRLAFDATTLDLVTKTCWLKGTVTGSDNDISVTWDM
ncbi:DUF5626 family protein [uncultured Oscillibacter sp.]|uniref:DUF5626 family protein n=1 Tax=uncultured Oscillibacter sp. TaxID=876091 RepID=UPI0025E05204|nr:DUF5626 family protein [uncultured Oscillibacter sp.]